MGVVLRGRQCAPNRIWTVLGFTDGAWHHVTGPWDRGPRIDGLAKVGDDIREEQPVFRKADHGCLATGGSRARLWHWDGTRLKAGAFHRAQRPDPRPRAFRVFGGALAATTLTCEFAGRGFALSAAGRLGILIPPPVEG